MKSSCSYSHGVGVSRYHVVFAPYRRYKMFGRADIQKALKDIFVTISERHMFEIFEMEIVKDHVHLFLGIRPSQSISQVIGYLKGLSSRYIRHVFPEMKAYHKQHMWSKGKYFRPIGEVDEETIRHYITESQSKHQHESKKPKAWWRKPKPVKWTPRQQTLDAFIS